MKGKHETFKNGVLVKSVPFTPEEEAESVERQEVEDIRNLLSKDLTSKQVEAILKKVVSRLFKKGILP